MPVATEETAGSPPCDFRGVSIQPTVADLQANARPFLRSIVTRGPYDSVAHYLDVNFRLLREDLIQPIRSGLQLLRNGRYLGPGDGGFTSSKDLSFWIENGGPQGGKATPVRLLTKTDTPTAISVANGGDHSLEVRTIQNDHEQITNGAKSVENGVVIENDFHPINNGIHSFENGNPSIENGVHPIVDCLSSSQNDALSVRNGGSPKQNGVHPVENGGFPGQEGGHPVQNGHRTIENDHNHVGNSVHHSQNDVQPIQHVVHSGELNFSRIEKHVEPVDPRDPIPEIGTHCKQEELQPTSNGNHAITPDSCSVASGSLDSELILGVSQSATGDSSEPPRPRREQQLNVYRGVRLVNVFGVQGFGVVHRVAFNERLSRLPSRVDWDATKRLLTGSLVLLSIDNFRSFVQAVVVMRRSNELSRGLVSLKLLDEGESVERAAIDGRSTYVMAESPSYFEAYRYFLQGLQRLDHKSLPFSKYLVQLVREVDPPRYLTSQSECNLECFRQGDPPSAAVEPLRCRFLDPETWPDAASLHLDEAQYRALNTALTKELALIQGPPGTGKTYLGLKIVNVLLDSQPVGESSQPILVLCHTNHALDQFLEGTLLFCSDGVIRVGGRSKSAKLERFTLNAIKQELRQNRDIPLRFFRPKRRLVDEMRRCAQRMNQWRRMLDDSRRRVMDPTELRKLMQSRYLVQFMPNTALYSSLDKMQGLTEWLGVIDYDSSDDSRPSSRQEWMREAPRPAPPKPTYQLGGWNVAVASVLAREEMERRLEDEYSVDDGVYEAVPPRRPVDKVTVVHRRKVFAAAEDEVFDATGIIFEDYDFPGRPAIPRMGPGDSRPPATDQGDEMQQKRNIANLLRDRRTSTREEAECVGDVWQLCLEDRWRLYRYWLSQFQSTCQLEIDTAQRQYEKLNQQYVDLDDQFNVELLSGAKIIGMTTTGAAKFRCLLQKVAPRVVVIEEAAEVLEANLLATLHSDCQHLILIGDQQQLRPHTAVHRLNIKYHFDVSLFERLIANDVHYERLLLQYRMRPDISNLLVPHIYPELADHESVCRYGNVRGMATNVFFMSHQLGESDISDSASKFNQFEAEYLVRLCHYLIQQGHQPSTITILTTYVGQLFAIKRQVANYPGLRDVTCTVVDNYQGKENDIILLSLVRSNSRGTVGFIQSDNRTCVALSRAKRGLYCVGNFELLKGNAPVWRCVVGLLLAGAQVGPAMKLRCSNHPDTVTEVMSVADFEDKAPEGGCDRLCETVLPCGHPCPLWCHSYDTDHSEMLCQQPCQKTCFFGHPCPRPCSTPCGPCPVLVDRELHCEHVKQVTCYQNSSTTCHPGCRCFLCFCDSDVPITTCLKGHYQLVRCYASEGREFKPKKCAEPCVETLSCGHRCPGTCAEPCELFKCVEPVSVACRRNHTVEVPCHRTEDEDWIQNSCLLTVTLSCGHEKNLPCLQVPQSEKHNEIDADDNCELAHSQIHECHVEVVGLCGFGHQVFNVPCSEAKDSEAVGRLCQEPCTKILLCGHSCAKTCGNECTASSKCGVVVIVKSTCGHDALAACGQRDAVTTTTTTNDCHEPCDAVLPCGHTCAGTCFDCHQGRMHVACKEKSERVMVCGHYIIGRCGRAPEPCLAECGNQCYHRRCRRRCCVTCEEPCRQPCHWYCRHYRCTRLCGELCDRPPCDQPCHRLLLCGHQCIGYCGEPCPRMCRHCNADELSFDKENPGARFVLLENCGHAIQSSVLDELMGPEEPQSWYPHEHSRLVRVKICPRCHVPIRQNLRYGNLIKATLADVAQVKQRIFSEFVTLQNAVRHGTLYREIQQALQCRPPGGALAASFRQLETELNRRRFRLYEINLIKNKVAFLLRMSQLLARIEEASDPEFVRERLLALEPWLLKLDGRQERYGEQAMLEFSRELARVFYLYQLEVKIPKSTWDSPLYSKVYDKVTGMTPFSLAVERVVIDGLRQLLSVDRGSGASDQVVGAIAINEDFDIKKTLILNSGLWFCGEEGRYYHCSGSSSYERV